MDPKHSAALRRTMRMDGNEVCADCFVPNPTWASTNLGIFLCIKCAGVHRAMGTHISKVKSLSLDKWEISMVENMAAIGNAKSNSYFLATCPANVGITENASGVERDAFIRDKYVNKRFAHQAVAFDGTASRDRNGIGQTTQANPDVSLSEKDSAVKIPKSISKQKPTRKVKAQAPSEPGTSSEATLSLFTGLSVSKEEPAISLEKEEEQSTVKVSQIRRAAPSPWVTKVEPEMKSVSNERFERKVIQKSVKEMKLAEPAEKIKVDPVSDLLIFEQIAPEEAPVDILSPDAGRNSTVMNPTAANHSKSSDPFADLIGSSDPSSAFGNQEMAEFLSTNRAQVSIPPPNMAKPQESAFSFL